MIVFIINLLSNTLVSLTILLVGIQISVSQPQFLMRQFSEEINGSGTSALRIGVAIQKFVFQLIRL